MGHTGVIKNFGSNDGILISVKFECGLYQWPWPFIQNRDITNHITITGASGQDRPPPPVHPHPQVYRPRDFLYLLLINLSFSDIFLF